TEGGVMAAQPLPVAEDRPGQPEGAHRDDRGEQQHDLRPLVGADDEPSRGRRQGDAGGGGDATEQAGDEETAREAKGVAHRETTASPRATWWSARATRSAWWLTAMTVRVRASRVRACPIVATESGSTCAVGSSRRTTGASERRARARTSRARCPAERPKPSSPT